jgi:hypothetical protein
MKINKIILEKARTDKSLTARLALSLDKSTRTIERYISNNSFPDNKEAEIMAVFGTYSNQEGTKE